MHVDTGHNFPEVDRVPRPAGRRARRPARRGVGAGVHRRRARSSRRPVRGASATGCRRPTLLDAIAEHALRRRVRRRPPRRGEGPGQGARVLLPRRVRAVGPEEPAARAVEPLQRPAPQGRAHPRVPAVELDRARHLAVHRRRGHRAAVDLLRAPARGVPPRRHVAGGEPVRHACWTARSRSRRWCATARSATCSCTGAVESTAATVDESIVEVAATRITERGATRADDRFSEAAMEDRKREGYF